MIKNFLDPNQFKAAEIILSFIFIFLPLLLGLIHALVKDRKRKIEIILCYYVVISIGIQGLLTGVVEIAQPQLVVDYVKVPYSPFLLELGMANLSFGILGILAIWFDKGWRAATAAGYGLFLLFTGIGHIIHIVQKGITPADMGGFLCFDLLASAILFILLLASSKVDTVQC